MSNALSRKEYFIFYYGMVKTGYREAFTKITNNSGLYNI